MNKIKESLHLENSDKLSKIFFCLFLFEDLSPTIEDNHVNSETNLYVFG